MHTKQTSFIDKNLQFFHNFWCGFQMYPLDKLTACLELLEAQSPLSDLVAVDIYTYLEQILIMVCIVNCTFVLPLTTSFKANLKTYLFHSMFLKANSFPCESVTSL